MEFQTLVISVHYIVCVLLVIVILLQAGRGADAGAAFGAWSSGTVFGPRGAATFLSKLTTGLAITFLLTSLFLVSFSKKQDPSVIKPGLDATETQPDTQPETKPSK